MVLVRGINFQILGVKKLNQLFKRFLDQFRLAPVSCFPLFGASCILHVFPHIWEAVGFTVLGSWVAAAEAPVINRPFPSSQNPHS